MREREVLLVRHARAGDRASWTRPDDLRPLTASGRRQAEALVELFADRPLARLGSSPFVRCVQTLEPLAAARGLAIETFEELSDGMPPDPIEELVLSWGADGPSAICMHGEALRALMNDLLDRQVHLRGNLVAFGMGATWILGVEDGSIVSARYLPPPPDRGRSVAS